MRRYLPFIIVVTVAVATLAGGTALYHAKRPPELTISNELSLKKDAESGLHIRGSADAPITLEEFGDFQCPPCGLLSGPIKQIEHEFAPKVRVIFHNFPLATHQHARTAACAAEAAGLQGKFWQMHDLIYQQQKEWSKATDAQPLFNSYAGILGLDLERFKKDLASEQVQERVNADQKRGTALGVQNTPTIFMNNKAIAPTDLAPDRLRLVVAEAVKQPTPAP